MDETWRNELGEFLAIPSVSADPAHREDVKEAGEWVCDFIRRIGGTADLTPFGEKELALGEIPASTDPEHAPTVLVYGHFDVQPPAPLDLWETDPFELTIKDEWAYARGIADDKGQVFILLKAAQQLVEANALPVNLRIAFDGEEEIGGHTIVDYLAVDDRGANAAIIFDGGMLRRDVPVIDLSVRGLIAFDVEVRTGERDLHSGMYGGAAPNAVYGLIELLAKAKDSDGRLQIPGIYDDVAAPDPAELESWKALPFSERDFLQNEVGASQLTGEPEQPVLSRVWARPTFEVHGIAGGFTGAGAKTVIPAKAVAKVSLRLVPDQKPDQVVAAVQQWIRENTPKGIQTEVRVLSAGPAISVNPNHPAIQIAASVFSESLGKPTVFIRSGGSIPIVGEFATHLGIPTVLMGFGLPDDGLHSPNEKYRISNYYDGIRTIARFLDEYGSHSA